MYDVCTMKRTNIYLRESQLGLLRRVSESRGKPVAELVRDAVDTWLNTQGIQGISEDEWQARFDALLGRRVKIAAEKGFSEEQVRRDVNAAVREVRRRRAARRR